MPAGARQAALEDAFRQSTLEAFQYRILVFDEKAASIYGQLMGHRRSIGRPLGVLDGQIAAIACANQMSLATRNTRDFEECGLNVINPFS